MLLGNLFKYWTYQVFAPGTFLKERYAAFKSLLAHDKRAHELIAELEEIYYLQQKRDFYAVVNLCHDLSQQVGEIVADLSRVCPTGYPDLALFYKKIDAYIRFMTSPEKVDPTPPYAVALADVSPGDLSLVGGKALNLAVLRNQLYLPVPSGFVITTNAFHRFMEANHLRADIETQLAALDIHDTNALDALAADIQGAIRSGTVPVEIKETLDMHWPAAVGATGAATRLAVRSSAVGEDSTASFAGQYKTVLNVTPDDLIDAYREVIAGKYAPGAIYYRIRYGLTDIETPMAVLVLRMIDANASGVLYTTDIADPESQNLSIHAVRGLGETLVSGETSADILKVAKKPELRIVGKRPAGEPQLGVALDDIQILQLARWGRDLEDHFEQPQDIEWAVNREQAPVLLQSRPLRQGAAPAEALECTFGAIDHDVLLQGGERAAAGIAAGPVYNLVEHGDLPSVPEGAVLVARKAAPEYVKIINRLSAVVTDLGSAAGHFASVAREFGVPTLVGTTNATAILTHGRMVTVNPDLKTVYADKVNQMLDSPCAQPDLLIGSPFMRKLQYILKFVSPLVLVDPEKASFTPQHCRSLHDVIRFAHEKAVRAMFHISDNRLRKLSFAKKLQTAIPLNFYILDVGDGLKAESGAAKEITIDAVANQAVQSLWQGLSHPDIQWGDFSHFDWEAHDRIVMSGGIASPEATMFASHAVISGDYMNLNLKFGYHFVIVDALWESATSAYSILFRFSGGGADLAQRMLRAEFLQKVLQQLGFDVRIKSDLIDGQLKDVDSEQGLQALDMLGRLLGATRLMDMYLQETGQIDGFVDDFMNGRYHFASVD